MRARVADGNIKILAMSRVIEGEVGRGHVPGAVALVARDGRIVFHEAFGRAQVVPREIPMRRDAIFDLASLTKPCATALALMLLADAGVVHLRDRVAKWLPAFAGGGKGAVTLLHLLTHTGGLDDAGLYDARAPMRTIGNVFDLICRKSLFAPPGTATLYADMNYITLGKVVEAASGLTLAEFFRRKIAAPLRLRDTGFNPPPAARRRAVATEEAEGRMLVGEVHDPRARLLGGVAGHAGLFGTARDILAIPQMLLDGGRWRGRRILSERAARMMTEVKTPPGVRPKMIGWDTDPEGTGPRGDLFPFGGFGHTGFTGTSLWADPASRTVIVLLASRLHPRGKGTAEPLRRRAANAVALAMGTGGGTSRRPSAAKRVQTGAEVLAGSGFRSLHGKRIGLVTNLAAVNRGGTSTLEMLAEAPAVELAVIFTPEHGLEAKLEGKIAGGTHGKRSIPMRSLYGETQRPAPADLAGLDALVIDLPDIGARFYTYATTMAYCLEEAAKAKVKVVVLDRPNPITGTRVEGPLLPESSFSFIAYASMPVRHGMTLGELARFFNGERGIGAGLEVVRMRGWRREMWFDETGAPWANPSPNIRNLGQAILYPGVGLLEATNLSVGRGTDTPFELFGAPWLDGAAVARDLNARGLPGVKFHPVRFTPAAGPHRGKECGGCGVVLTDRETWRPVLTGVATAEVIRRRHGKEFALKGLDHMIGSPAARQALERGESAEKIAESWAGDEKEFRKRMRKYLLY